MHRRASDLDLSLLQLRIGDLGRPPVKLLPRECRGGQGTKRAASMLRERLPGGV
jgi:hypothetical protein